MIIMPGVLVVLSLIQMTHLRRVAVAALFLQAVAAAQTDQGSTMLAPILRTENVGGGVVRIVYDLRSATGASVSIALEASNDGGRTFFVRPHAVTGDVGERVSPGAEKTIVWDSTKDIDDLQVDRYVFRVRVSTTGPNAAVTGSPAAGSGTPPGGRGASGAAPGSGTTAAKKGGLGKGALIGIIGGGATAAAVGASASKGGSSASPSTTPSSTPPATGTTTSFSGTSQLSGTLTTTFRSCTRVEAWTGALRLDFQVLANNTVSGTATGNGTTVVTFVTCPGGPQLNAAGTFTVPQAQVTGTTSAVAFRFAAGPTRSVDGCCSVSYDYTFAGSLSNGAVTGTLTFNTTIQPDNSTDVGTGTVAFSVSARP